MTSTQSEFQLQASLLNVVREAEKMKAQLRVFSSMAFDAGVSPQTIEPYVKVKIDLDSFDMIVSSLLANLASQALAVPTSFRGRFDAARGIVYTVLDLLQNTKHNLARWRTGLSGPQNHSFEGLCQHEITKRHARALRTALQPVAARQAMEEQKAAIDSIWDEVQAILNRLHKIRSEHFDDQAFPEQIDMYADIHRNGDSTRKRIASLKRAISSKAPVLPEWTADQIQLIKQCLEDSANMMGDIQWQINSWHMRLSADEKEMIRIKISQD